MNDQHPALMTMIALQHAANVADARAAYALYQAMRTEDLLNLQEAHTLDVAAATTPEAIAFGAGRLALIAAVLSQRGAAVLTTTKNNAASITCPFCGAVSYNANDIAHQYCGACHRYHDPDADVAP